MDHLLLPLHTIYLLFYLINELMISIELNEIFSVDELKKISFKVKQYNYRLLYFQDLNFYLNAFQFNLHQKSYLIFLMHWQLEYNIE